MSTYPRAATTLYPTPSGSQLSLFSWNSLSPFPTLKRAWGGKVKAFSKHMKSARIHTRDAVPITLGQEFSAYEQMVSNHSYRIETASKSLELISLGGTAVGTKLNTPPGFSKKVLAKLRQMTGYDLRQAPNFYEKTQFTSDFLHLMNVLSALCVDIVKMNNARAHAFFIMLVDISIP
jgi:fumarate hydratase class II